MRCVNANKLSLLFLATKKQNMPSASCAWQEAMLGVGLSFVVSWALLLTLWLIGVCWHCARSRCKKCQPLQWLMLTVPFFHIGNASWEVYTYTYCDCMECVFHSFGAYYAWVGTQYAFSLGRFAALLLCLFLISTGAGSVRARLLLRNWCALVLLFGGFLTASALGLPLNRAQSGASAGGTLAATIGIYVAIVGVTLLEASMNCRVLKAQLVMIRQQGIAPRSCPSFYKFRLFMRLRRYVLAYFAAHALIIGLQLVEMRLQLRVTLIVGWELAQLLITALVGRLFLAHGSRFNPYLDREAHLPAHEVRQPIDATGVRLSWHDTTEVLAADEDEDEDDAGVGGEQAGESQRLLLPWHAGLAVPAPPSPPPMLLSVRLHLDGCFQLRGRRHRPRCRARTAGASSSSHCGEVDGGELVAAQSVETPSPEVRCVVSGPRLPRQAQAPSSAAAAEQSSASCDA
jgi:hypothetical protein